MKKEFEIVIQNAITLNDDFEITYGYANVSKIVFFLPDVSAITQDRKNFDTFIDGVCVGMGFNPVNDRWVNYMPEDRLFILYLSSGSKKCDGSTVSTVERHKEVLEDLQDDIEAMIFYVLQDISELKEV